MQRVALYHRSILNWCLVFICLPAIAAENDNQESYQIEIKRAQSAMLLDGLFDEADWAEAQVYRDFWLNQPIDSKRADRQTEVRMTYDDRFIYLAVTLYGPDDYVIQTLKRDAFGESDEFAVFLDPVNQRTNGYGFGVNALGAQSEALMTVNDGDPSWDNKWYSETRTYPDRWTIEMAIPFKSIRYEADRKVWGINFLRLDAQHNPVRRNRPCIGKPIRSAGGRPRHLPSRRYGPRRGHHHEPRSRHGSTARSRRSGCAA